VLDIEPQGKDVLTKFGSSQDARRFEALLDPE
jgi:hypothetical protein